MTPEVYRAETLAEVSRMAAEHIYETALEEVKRKNSFSLGLAGGKTPRLLYEFLAAPPISFRMPWENTHLFWGDERWVPSHHPDSNFAMAVQSLLSKIEIPSTNIHPIPTDLESAEKGARTYERTLQELVRLSLKKRDSFDLPTRSRTYADLILLGMGEDGHTASLFPNSRALAVTSRWVAAVEDITASPPVPRITLTLPFINRARNVIFLISGAKKRAISESILREPINAARLYPAARVRPQERLQWFIAEI